jgi:hypothetical protein
MLLFGFVRDAFGALPSSGPLMLLLCGQISLVGVLTALPGAFISGQVIFFAVVLGAGAMGVGSNVTALSRYLL